MVPATLVILVGLFAIQYRGTGSVGRLFGPVMVVWFLVIGILGSSTSGSARNPSALIRWRQCALRITSPLTLFVVLGGVFLALTGGEALYADMGHVGRRAIRQAWFGLVFPALILNYFGQGAHVLVDPKAVDNPFYSLAPAWALIPMVLLAAAGHDHRLASADFRRVLDDAAGHSDGAYARAPASCRPRAMKPDRSIVPTANWLLMAGTLLVVPHVQDLG